MSEPEGPSSALEHHFEAQSRRRDHRRRRRFSSCLPVLLVLALMGGLGYYGVVKGLDTVQGWFAAPDDYEGPGEGEVLFEVVSGQSIRQIGRNLEDEGVVASEKAFTEAASKEPLAVGIQAGYYELRQRMSAREALEVLIDPGQLVTSTVTVPEGLSNREVVQVLAKHTDYQARRFERILEREADTIGLPDYANGNAEGYLFPATYAFGPNARPKDMLREMVARWRRAAESVDLEGRAEQLGYTPHEVMTVASLVEAEASRAEDRDKVARVIYNRLEHPDRAGARLQLDATVNYAHGRALGARTTSDHRSINSPYNTYRVEGLPPGPIEAPGEAALEAALDPAEGDWVFYVTVNLATGETKFAETAEGHQRNVDELNRYCREESDRC